MRYFASTVDMKFHFKTLPSKVLRYTARMSMRTAESAQYNRMMSAKLARRLPPLHHQRRKVQSESSDDESCESSEDMEASSQSGDDDFESGDEDTNELIDHSESCEPCELLLPVLNPLPKITDNMRWSKSKCMFVEVIDLSCL